jgi:hypothetical protein
MNFRDVKEIDDHLSFLINKKVMEKEGEGETKVVNLKISNLRKMGYSSFKDWIADEKNVYLGPAKIDFGNREVKFTDEDSIWWNDKFYEATEKGTSRGDFVKSKKELQKGYEKYIRNRIDKYPQKYNLESLRGKNLGVWDPNPNLSHGAVLIRLLNE